MDKIEFNKLLEAGESSWLDWKQDFPPGLLKNKTDPQWEQGKGTLLKDLVSIANGEGEQWGYLIYGVKDLGTTREVKGITKNWDDATFQSWVKNAFDPPPRFLYLELAWDPAKTVGIFQIERIPEYPHVTNTSIGKVLLDGQVWFRKGTKNTVAHRAELQTMILGHQPVISPTIEGPVIEKAVSYYQELGFELAFPLITDKDNKILKGYTVACYPGTRREVHVGDVNGRQEHILMLKPRE